MRGGLSMYDIFDPYDAEDARDIAIFKGVFGVRDRYSGGYGRGGFGYDGEIDRGSFQAVSNRARRAQDEARNLFLEHLATVDTSGGPVTTEIIKFHLVPDMRKAFTRLVKEYACSATSRKLTREEQDRVNKTRKSLMMYTSVCVTPDAQRAYLEKNPQVAERVRKAKEAPAAPVASGSGSAALKRRDVNAAGLDQPEASSSKPVAKKAKA